jgi:hypothetical protein
MVDKLLSPNISISSSNSSKYVLQFPLLLPFLNIENEIPLTLFPQECVDWILYNIAIYLKSVPSYCLQGINYSLCSL